MIRKWKWLLLAVAVLFLVSGLWFAFHDRPAFSKDEVTAMVANHFKISSSNVLDLKYLGSGKWTGIVTGIGWSSNRYPARFNFYEKIRVTEELQ